MSTGSTSDGSEDALALLDAGRARFATVLALVAVVVQAVLLESVDTVSGAAVEFAIVVLGVYAGLTAGDVLWERYLAE